jgi:uncharacterized protein
MVHVTVCWSFEPRRVHEISLVIPNGSTVQAVIEQLMDADMHSLSTTDLAKLKFLQPGIWGHKVAWSACVQQGDRIELYRDLKVDPKVARRQRFKRQGKGRTGLFANRKSGVAAGY